MLYSFKVAYLPHASIDQVASLHYVQCNKFAPIPLPQVLGPSSLPVDLTLKPFLFHRYSTHVIRSLTSSHSLKYSAS